jgi:hypothetical protein
MAFSTGIVKEAFAFLYLLKAEDSSVSLCIQRHCADIRVKFNGNYTPHSYLKSEKYRCHSKQDESLHSWFSFENLAHSFWILNTAWTQSGGYPVPQGYSSQPVIWVRRLLSCRGNAPWLCWLFPKA